MDEDVPGLNDDDNPAREEVDATADEAILEDQSPESMKAETDETPSCPRTSRRRQLSQTQATIDHVRRANSHCDQFGSPERRAVEGCSQQRRRCFQHVRKEQVDRGERDQEDQRADRITDDTLKENTVAAASSPLRMGVPTCPSIT